MSPPAAGVNCFPAACLEMKGCADITHHEKRLDRAERAYLQALDLAPWEYWLVHGAASYYRRHEQPEKALRLYEERRHLFADRGEFLETLGQFYEKIRTKKNLPLLQKQEEKNQSDL